MKTMYKKLIVVGSVVLVTVFMLAAFTNKEEVSPVKQGYDIVQYNPSESFNFDNFNFSK